LIGQARTNSKGLLWATTTNNNKQQHGNRATATAATANAFFANVYGKQFNNNNYNSMATEQQ